MMGSKLFRMKLLGTPTPGHLPPQFNIVLYSPVLHHEVIRHIYSEAFGEEPWPTDWDAFEEFDPKGVFVVSHSQTDRPVGYIISFRREDFGYISVVAVIPEFRRQGLAPAMITAAIDYLQSLSLREVVIDVHVKNTPAVEAYKKLGFQVVEVFEG
jgi:ribosomal protein S18 acetylase RimI-like enzyme